MPVFQPILPNTERNKEVTDGLTGFLPPGMDMVLESLLSAFLPTTDEDAMQQMSDSVLADLALGIITPSQGRTAREFIENTLEAMTPGVRQAQISPQKSDLMRNLFSKHSSSIPETRNSEFVVPRELTIEKYSPSSDAIAFMGGGAIPPAGIRPYRGINPRFTGTPSPEKTQMVLLDGFFNRPLGGQELSRSEVLAHELGHIPDLAVGTDLVFELLEDPRLTQQLRQAIVDGGQPRVVDKITRGLPRQTTQGEALDTLFSEGIASLFQIGEKLPRAITNKIPELAGLESFIDNIVFGRGSTWGR